MTVLLVNRTETRNVRRSASFGGLLLVLATMPVPAAHPEATLKRDGRWVIVHLHTAGRGKAPASCPTSPEAWNEEGMGGRGRRGAILILATAAAHDLFLKPERFFVEPHYVTRIGLFNGKFSTSESAVKGVG